MRFKEEWPEILVEWIHKNKDVCLTRDRFDCVRQISDVVEQCTGVDLAADFRDKYETDFQAARLVRKNGGMLKMVEKIMEQYGIAEVTDGSDQAGDLFYIPFSPFGVVAIGIGGGFCATQGTCGLEKVRTIAATKNWRIDR